MKYQLIIAILIVAVIVAIVFILINRNRKISTKEPETISGTEDKASNDIVPVELLTTELSIKVDMLPAETISKKGGALAEITDSNVLARINQVVPNLSQAGNAVNNATQVAKAQGGVFYRAIIPAGAKLVESKDMQDAVRGIYRGAKGIQGHANLVAVEAQKGGQIVSNAASSAMGVASMVVGQYYMKQLNDEISELNDGVEKIGGFQDNEYRSKVQSLVSHIQSITNFQVEIIDNDELRLSKIYQLDDLEMECTQLLGQANITLAKFTEKTDIKYSKYEEVINEVQQWHNYQSILLKLLEKIADLKYALHLGNVSREHCSANLLPYADQVQKTQGMLTEWHEGNIERLKIDMPEQRRKRDGFDGVIHFLPGLFKDELKYKKMDEDTVILIDSQSSAAQQAPPKAKAELYDEDVQIIAKDGKYYYLPEANDK